MKIQPVIFYPPGARVRTMDLRLACLALATAAFIGLMFWHAGRMDGLLEAAIEDAAASAVLFGEDQP